MSIPRKAEANQAKRKTDNVTNHYSLFTLMLPAASALAIAAQELPDIEEKRTYSEWS
jgi:hypothetical protein